jgi:menaquinone-9 beta-reductase
MNPVTIIGGGLAGLALGGALARNGVPVTLHEAGRYPRHRVCGEFLAGLDEATLDTLGIRPALAGARLHTSTIWIRGGRTLLEAVLPSPARGLSRHRIDRRLAEALTDAGGRLVDGSRIPTSNTPAPGTVLACGRRAGRPGWIGLKVHLRGLRTRSDLELHLSRAGYVGLAGVEDGRSNLCGLFRTERLPSGGRLQALLATLRASGFPELAERVAASDPDPDSFCSVSNLDFTPPAPDATALRIGDALGVIPPFTGNGMTIALQSAATALPHLLDYARGGADWPATLQRANAALSRRFGRRFRVAARLQPLLLSPSGLGALALLARARLLPFHLLYKLTH